MRYLYRTVILHSAVIATFYFLSFVEEQLHPRRHLILSHRNESRFHNRSTTCIRKRGLSYSTFIKNPNSICCITHDTSRHDKHEVSCESWRDVTWRAVSCVLRRACSNMADDEDAVVHACNTPACFIIIYYFSSRITNKQSCVSRLSRSSRLDARRLLYSMRDTSRTLYPVPKCMG